MATILAPSYRKGTVLRPADQTQPSEAEFSLYFQDGKAAYSGGDIVKIVRIGENVTVLATEIDVNGSLGASGLTLDLGTDLVADCFIDGSAIGNGAGGIVAAVGGLPSTSGFADGYIAPSNAVRDLQLSFIGTIATPVTNTVRKVTVRVKFGYSVSDTIVTGVTSERYPFSGSEIVEAATIMDYNGKAYP